MSQSFEIGKKYVRGVKKGKSYTEKVELENRDAIYSYLWDRAEEYENNKVNFIIEWYSPK